MIIEVPVIQTPEKTQQVMNTYVQHVVEYSRSGEAQNHRWNSAETHHPGEDEPGDQAR